LYLIPLVRDTFCSRYLFYLKPFVSDTYCDDSFFWRYLFWRYLLYKNPVFSHQALHLLKAGGHLGHAYCFSHNCSNGLLMVIVSRKPSFVIIVGGVASGNNICHGEHCTVIFYWSSLTYSHDSLLKLQDAAKNKRITISTEYRHHGTSTYHSYQIIITHIIYIALSHYAFILYFQRTTTYQALKHCDIYINARSLIN